MRRNWMIIAVWTLLALPGWAQRVYKTGSVLASGAWYRISVTAPGVYRIDLPFLRSLGVNTDNLSSSGIRLFGNGGAMLPEPGNGIKTDDLVENSIDMEDGGDGIFNGGDYFLFYAPGPHAWLKDSVSRQFSHVKNIYTEAAVYFLTVGSGGGARRIPVSNDPRPPNISVSSFDLRSYHELDTINFLSSGKDWYGEEFANIPGGTVTRSFNVVLPHPDSSQAFFLKASCMARSVGIGSRFNTSVNGTPVSELDIPSVTDGSYDVFGKVATSGGPGAAGFAFHAGGSPFSLAFTYTPGGYNAQGWLDWWEVSARGLLSLQGLAQLSFRDWSSVGNGHIGSFWIRGADAATVVWDITDPAGPVAIQGTLSGDLLTFTNDCGRLHEYIAFARGAKALPGPGGNGAPGSAGTGPVDITGGGPYGFAGVDPNGANIGAVGLFTPGILGKVDNQNLHQPSVPDMLIISDPALLSQAQRLAAFHQQQDHLKILVVTAPQVYNEFGGGSPDPVALRDYVKMFYDRSGGDSTKRPRYLLLLGAGSFDYKDRLTGNTNGMPAYESGSSLDPLNTYTSDDFYGFLQDVDDVNAINSINLLDISVGRIPARTPAEASAVVDKIFHYADPKTQGPWRNEVSLVADDGDQNLHFTDAETFAGSIATTDPVLNTQKIYLDAYQEQNTPAGGRYPLVNQAITSQLYNGVLIWNYAGHGSNSRLSNEDILDQSIINGINNPDRLSMFITATCDFAPYDNPLIQSIGANLLVRPATGAIALMTTTRLVFAFSNKTINNNYWQIACRPKADGTFYSLGDAGRITKNFTYQTQTDAVNNRKFTLLGDPALTLAFPRLKVQTTSINGKALGATQGAAPTDTLKALNSYTLAGTVTDNYGALLTGFNGTLYMTVYDKPRTLATMGNSASSLKADFQVQDNVLYKGKVTVNKGLFSYSFVLPKDINYQFGKGKISYYAGSGTAAAAGADEAGGFFTNFLIGGSGGGGSYLQGPVIQAYLNDEKFVDGGITNATPILLLHLQDSLGINVTGLGIGHELTAVLDNNTQNPLVLNGFYEADLNTYKRGTVRYPMPVLSEGEHTLLIRVWDVANNSSVATLTFRVIPSLHLTLKHVLNYPNPFTTHTTFWFEHNRPNEDLQVLVQILTVSGKLVKTIRRTINTTGNRSSEVEWDARDDYGSKIGKGVYIYRLRVRATDGSVADAFEKLYLM